MLLLKSYRASYLNTSQNHTQFEAYPNVALYNFNNITRGVYILGYHKLGIWELTPQI